MRFFIISFLSILVSLTVLRAQWTSDSLSNTQIIAASGEQVVSKIKATSDGGCYISWYDNRNGNYDVYMQRLTSQGEKVWATDGLLISDHPQDTWVTDYDLAVDQNDNAIIVFNDIRNGSDNGWDVFAYKISPDGDFLWGPDGIGLSPTTNSESEMSPKVTVTSAGNYVFAWTRSGETDVVALQKLAANGDKLWGTDGITIQGQQSANANHPFLVSAANDSAIVLWKNVAGSYPTTKTFLLVQKLTPNGTFAWDANGVVVYDSGNIPVYYDPLMISDEQSGAFIVWEEQPTSSESYVEVGHVGANGSLIFPLNGIKASTTSARLHFDPSISFISSQNALFTFWRETNQSQNQYGIYGQKFDASGNRLWGEEGKTFIPLGGRSISFVSSASTDTSIYVGYFQSSAPNAYDAAVKDFLSNPNGSMLWGPVILSAASLGDKDDLVLSLNPDDQALFAWTDKRSDDGDIYAQNSNPNGSLGNLAAGIEGNILSPVRNFTLFQNYPNPFNPETTIPYYLNKDQQVTLVITNSLGQCIRSLNLGFQTAGFHQFVFKAYSLPSGFYYYRLKTGNAVEQRKMLLVK